MRRWSVGRGFNRCQRGGYEGLDRRYLCVELREQLVMARLCDPTRISNRPKVHATSGKVCPVTIKQLWHVRTHSAALGPVLASRVRLHKRLQRIERNWWDFRRRRG